ncbi:MAG: hypothetical protein AB7S71_12725 [Dongiaceae bacterium]
MRAAARARLSALIGAEVALPVGAATATLVETILRRHGAAIQAVLFYGSCLRRGDPTAAEDPVYDFYLLVDDYRRVYDGRLAAWANAVLPPNVFYIEIPWRERSLRAKYAVVTLAQFRRAVSPRALQSYFWARFAQPVRLPFARDDTVRAAVVDALADAVSTLALRTAGLMEGSFMPAAFWTRAFEATYGAELRTEGLDRARLVYAADGARYDGLSLPALQAAGIEARIAEDGRLSLALPAQARRGAAAAWRRRRLLGKLLSALRLAKGAFTFDGGVDYILWKIERHSGVAMRATDWQRRHPLLAAPALAWRLHRRGAFR